jgi:hypothetical protein
MTPQMNRTIRESKKRLVMGVDCWTPGECARVIGVSRNTVLGWARKTKAGRLDMPMMSAPIKRALVFIPVKAFLDWYGFPQN